MESEKSQSGSFGRRSINAKPPRLEKIVKSTSRTNKASLQGVATGTALLLVFAVSLATSGFVLSANANERKTAIITFDAPGAGTGAGQGTFAGTPNPAGAIVIFYQDASNVLHGALVEGE
jgi:hypothetical protein